MASQEIVNMCGYGVLIKFYFSGLMWLDMHNIQLILATPAPALKMN